MAINEWKDVPMEVFSASVLMDRFPVSDAIIAWNKLVENHLKQNGVGCDISKNETLKYWFIKGYETAKEPQE